MGTFTRFTMIDCPEAIPCGPDGEHEAFEVGFTADGEIPFPQVILHAPGQALLLKGEAI